LGSPQRPLRTEIKGPQACQSPFDGQLAEVYVGGDVIESRPPVWIGLSPFETFRKLYPVDIYLELGAYAWGGTLNQPSGTITERMAKLRTDNKLFVNREIFNQFSAAREVEFEEKMAAASRR
jgi:hypothetical protein